jgi:hypothetical protein
MGHLFSEVWINTLSYEILSASLLEDRLFNIEMLIKIDGSEHTVNTKWLDNMLLLPVDLTETEALGIPSGLLADISMLNSHEARDTIKVLIERGR